MPVNTAKRREHIIDLLCEHGSVRVEQLSKQFAVSTVTIRNDLRFWNEKGVRCALTAARCLISNSLSIGRCGTRGG